MTRFSLYAFSYAYDGCNRLARTVYPGGLAVTYRYDDNGYMNLDGNTIAVRENGELHFYLAFTDNLGSILSVLDENGTKVFDATYDAWGKQSVTLNTIGLHRGYTGHEMLNEFDIINMNGRLYDPVIGRFLSPDNYVQMPDNSQNFNRYSYCLNNPLKYTDPSGNAFGIDDVIAFAVFNMASSMMQASFAGKSVWKAGALSLLSSAASYGIGAAFKNVAGTFGNELLRAGAHGLASGVVSVLDGGNFIGSFVSGAAASGIGSYAQSAKMNSGLMVASTTVAGGFVAWATGGDFLQGAMQGMTIGLFNHAMHGENGNAGDNGLPVKVSVTMHKNGTFEVDVIASRMSTMMENLMMTVGSITHAIGGVIAQNVRMGSNGKYYLQHANGKVFHGNQYVKTRPMLSVPFPKSTGLVMDAVAQTPEVLYAIDMYGGNSMQVQRAFWVATGKVVGGYLGAEVAPYAVTAAITYTSLGTFSPIVYLGGQIGFGIAGGRLGSEVGGWIAGCVFDLCY